MLIVDNNILQNILKEYDITEKIISTEELLRYNYENQSPQTKFVRLMIKCSFADRNSVVIKLKQEKDVTKPQITQQVEFSQHLLAKGVQTAHFYRCGDTYVLTKTIHEYKVFITIEDFCPGEIKVISLELIQKIGALLATAHNISEKDCCHVNAPVLFDPFSHNDLFSHEKFLESEAFFQNQDANLFAEIERQYQFCLEQLAPLKGRNRYAVQGDFSDCNLYLTDKVDVGMFDFNRCGDAILFCDAIMQGVFISRLMEYDQPLTEEYAEKLFQHFLRGYHQARPFSEEEFGFIPYLYAIISAFWLPDIAFSDNSLLELLKAGETEKAKNVLRKINSQFQKKISICL